MCMGLLQMGLEWKKIITIEALMRKSFLIPVCVAIALIVMALGSLLIIVSRRRARS